MIPQETFINTLVSTHTNKPAMKHILRTALTHSEWSRPLDKLLFQKNQVIQEEEEYAQELNDMLNSLSTQELEVAARASYEYLMEPNPSKRSFYARQYAKCFLLAQDGNPQKALASLKDTISFREKMDVDKIRTSFTKKGDSNFAGKLEQEVQSRHVYVQGHDKEGRSTYIFVPRNVRAHDREWTLKHHVYTLERAVASSRAPDKTVNAIVDFKGFASGQAPPTGIRKEFISTLRNHYAAQHINNIFLIDVPASFLCLWVILKPILGKRARNKIRFVKSNQNELSKYYEPDQAAPWMMRGGKKKRELDVEEYLYKTSFDRAFDE